MSFDPTDLDDGLALKAAVEAFFRSVKADGILDAEAVSRVFELGREWGLTEEEPKNQAP
jgi:hypothetical protein